MSCTLLPSISAVIQIYWAASFFLAIQSSLNRYHDVHYSVNARYDIYMMNNSYKPNVRYSAVLWVQWKSGYSVAASGKVESIHPMHIQHTHDFSTLHIRVQRQSQSATQIALYLYSLQKGQMDPQLQHHSMTLPTPTRPYTQLQNIWHPSIPGHSDLQWIQTQMPRGYSPIVFIQARPSSSVLVSMPTHPSAIQCQTKHIAQQLPTQLKLFTNATSLGSVESLIDYRHVHDPTADPCLIRLSIGLESVHDLCLDLYQALSSNSHL